MRRGLAGSRRWIALALVPWVVSACEHCIEDPINPKAQEHAYYCAQYLAEGNLGSAEARGKLATEYAPKYAEGWNCLGLIEFARKNNQRAIELFKQAIAYRNDFAEGYNNLGAVLLETGDREFACDQFLQAIEIDPGYVNARINLAECHLHGHEYDTAETHYLRCVELDPNSCRCRVGLGSVGLAKEDFGAAQAHLQKLVEVCPTFAPGHFNLCYTNMRMGRCAEAVQNCTDALSQDPGMLEAKTNLAAAYDCLAKQDGAVKAYVAEINANPGDAEPHFKLATLYEERNLPNEALGELMVTLRLAPNHILAHYRAAQILDRLYRTRETVEMCKRFIELLRDGKHPDERAWCVDRVQQLQYQ